MILDKYHLNRRGELAVHTPDGTFSPVVCASRLNEYGEDESVIQFETVALLRRRLENRQRVAGTQGWLNYESGHDHPPAWQRWAEGGAWTGPEVGNVGESA